MTSHFDNVLGWREWNYQQEKHRHKIKEIYSSTSARIDNHLPEILLNPSKLRVKSKSIYGSILNVRDIDIKNAKILEKLTKMARTPVILKTLPTAENKINKRKYFLKKLENNKIHNENLLFAKRLAKTTSALSLKKYENDFINSEKYCQIRKKFK